MSAEMTFLLKTSMKASHSAGQVWNMCDGKEQPYQDAAYQNHTGERLSCNILEFSLYQI